MNMNLSTSAVTETSPVTEASPGSPESTKSPWCKERDAFDGLDAPIVRGNRFYDSVYKICDNLWENNGNDAGRLLSVTLDKLRKTMNDLCDKISQVQHLRIW